MWEPLRIKNCGSTLRHNSKKLASKKRKLFFSVPCIYSSSRTNSSDDCPCWCTWSPGWVWWVSSTVCKPSENATAHASSAPIYVVKVVCCQALITQWLPCYWDIDVSVGSWCAHADTSTFIFKYVVTGTYVCCCWRICPIVNYWVTYMHIMLYFSKYISSKLHNQRALSPL